MTCKVLIVEIYEQVWTYSMAKMNYKQLRMIRMKLEAFLNKQQKIHVSCQTWKSLKSFLEHNYMKSSFDFVYDLPHEFILTIKRYNLSSYEYVNFKYQQIELKWASIYPAWIGFKLARQKQAILHQENMNIWTCLVTLNYAKTITKYVTVTRDVIARRGPGT